MGEEDLDVIGHKFPCWFCGDSVEIKQGQKIPHGKCPTCKTRIMSTNAAAKLWAITKQGKEEKDEFPESAPPTSPRPIIPDEPIPKPELGQKTAPEPTTAHDPPPKKQKKKEGEEKSTYKGWG